jgi:methanogenic corrinoid protein MtbC1
MKKEEIFKNLFDAVVEMNVQKGKDAAALLIKKNYNPLEAIENGLSKGMKVIGEKFNKFEIYLPDLMMAARVFLIFHRTAKALKKALCSLAQLKEIYTKSAKILLLCCSK